MRAMRSWRRKSQRRANLASSQASSAAPSDQRDAAAERGERSAIASISSLQIQPMRTKVPM